MPLYVDGLLHSCCDCWIGTLIVGISQSHTWIPQERVVLFNYDLYLPDSFTPKVVDGEVHEFFRCDATELLDMMDLECSDPIKPNCYVVMIDFLIRHGIVSPDAPGYLDLVRALRSGECQ